MFYSTKCKVRLSRIQEAAIMKQEVMRSRCDTTYSRYLFIYEINNNPGHLTVHMTPANYKKLLVRKRAIYYIYICLPPPKYIPDIIFFILRSVFTNFFYSSKLKESSIFDIISVTYGIRGE